MSNSRTAMKRHHQSLRRRTRNRSARSRVRTSIKAFEAAVIGGERSAAEARFFDFVRLIDTAAGNGLYHRSTAAKKKSRLHKRLAALT